MTEYEDIRRHSREGHHRGTSYRIDIVLDTDGKVDGITTRVDGHGDAIFEHRPRFKSLDDAFAEAERRVSLFIEKQAAQS